MITKVQTKENNVDTVDSPQLIMYHAHVGLDTLKCT